MILYQSTLDFGGPAIGVEVHFHTDGTDFLQFLVVDNGIWSWYVI